MSLSPGTRLGPYEILAPLGAGGMGEVFRARDTRLDRQVAIKVLPEEFFKDNERRGRFEREAKLLAAVNHPNIAAIYAFEEISGRYLLIQELLEGEALRETSSRGAFPVRKALDIGVQVAEGLAAAHEKGIVHRDLKPENIFLTRDGHARILDFGLARHDISRRDAADTRSPTLDAVSEKGVVLGTVAYMSPEQARGEIVDFRSDQFSLGIVLYEMLTGKRPFGGASAAEKLAAIIRDEPEPLTKLDPKFPAPLGWVIQRCLSKEPEERYSSTSDLAKELQNLRTHLSEAVSAADIPSGKTPRLRRRVPFWASAAVAALAVVLGFLLVIRFVRTESSRASPLSLSLSFPLDAAPNTLNYNPFALTPNGKTLVYAGSENAVKKLFVRRLDRDETKPIPGTEGAYFPFISPDGLEVGFFAEGNLKKVMLVGGSPITLCNAPDARGGSWGADGTIIFAPGSKSGLTRIPASGGEPWVVTTPDPTSLESHRFPQILPDGEHVLFQIMNGNRPDRAAVVSLRTGELRILVEDAAYPRYLPTGHITFTRAGALFAISFNLKHLQTAGPSVPLLDDLVTNYAGMRCAEISFSDEGTLVYLPDRQLRRTLVWVDRKGAVEQIPFPPAGYQEVVVSPDGNRIAAISIDKGDRMALLIGDIARGTLSRSTAEGLFQGLAWAPDGKRIAFGFAPKEGALTWKVFWQNADESTAPERLSRETGTLQEDPTSFSPEGRLLLLDVANLSDTSTSNTGWDIFVLPLSGERTPHPFLQTKSDELFARFSPDGRWIAYQSIESGIWQIFVRAFPGPGPKWQISTDGGNDPRWSRSGRELFYRLENKMMLVEVDTKKAFRPGRPRTLFEGSFRKYQDAYDIAPDGTRFLLIKPDPAESGPTHVNVVLNWLDEVNRRVPRAK